MIQGELTFHKQGIRHVVVHQLSPHSAYIEEAMKVEYCMKQECRCYVSNPVFRRFYDESVWEDAFNVFWGGIIRLLRVG